jgi:translation initiation factor 3 subunit B
VTVTSENLPTKPVNSIRWSPRGRHVVLAALNLSQKFDLEFWDTDLFQDERKEVVWGSGIQLLSEPGLDHYGVTEVVWDPSGRFVVSLSSVWVRAVCLLPPCESWYIC